MITKQEFKERNTLLVQDLRDPANFQTTGALRIGDTYCCLGRACEVFRKNSQTSIEWKPEHESKFSFLERTGLPPEEVSEWYGWPCNDPTVGTSSMAGMNDTHCLLFKDIAEELESWVEKKIEEWETA